MTFTKSEKREIAKMCIIMMLVSLPEIFSYYSDEGILPTTIVRISMLLSFSILGYVSLKKASKPGYFTFVLIFAWMYFVSFFHLTPKTPYLTIFTFSVLMISGLLSREFSLRIIQQAFSILAIVFTGILIWQFSKTSIDIAIVLQRGYTWTEIFAYATLSSIWPICLFASYLERRHVGIAIIITIMAIIVQSISLKRSIFVEIGLAVAIIGWVSLKTKDIKTFRYIVWVGIPLVLIGTYYVLNSSIGNEVTQVSEAVSKRFSDTSEDMAAFDRFYESSKYFSEEANFFDILFGTGFFSAHHSFAEIHYFLHIGWTNLIFKGGLVLFFAFLVMELRAWHIFLNPSSYSKETLFAAMYCVLMFFQYFFGNYIGFGPSLFFLYYCLMRVNDATRNKQVTMQRI